MIRPGMVSVTFRKLSARQIVSWSAKAKLACIEWGGDVHVPPGESETARQVAAMTRDAGLVVASYGSYYRLGQEAPESFARVLETALALGAPIIRVWAGRLGSDKADATHRRQVADDGRRIAEMAQPAGVRIATEWHGNTLTDTAESAKALLDAVGHPAFRTYWQMNKPMTLEGHLDDLEAALPRLVGLHVSYDDPQTGQRRPLADGAAYWRPLLAKAAPAGDLPAMLEFVLNDDPSQMVHDASALREWLEETANREPRTSNPGAPGFAVPLSPPARGGRGNRAGR